MILLNIRNKYEMFPQEQIRKYAVTHYLIITTLLKKFYIYHYEIQIIFHQDPNHNKIVEKKFNN